MSLIEDYALETIDKIRKHNLKIELEDLKKITEYVVNAHSNKHGPKWFIIAVNKVDLFLDKINDAQKYYSLPFDSEFTRIINLMLKQIGELNIKCETIPISAWQKDFIWNNETIKTQLGGKEVECIFPPN